MARHALRRMGLVAACAGSLLLAGGGGAGAAAIAHVWSPPINVSTAGRNYDVQVALSSDGSRAVALWRTANGSDDVIMAASAVIEGSTAAWGTPGQISTAGSDAEDPEVALSANGTRATAVWIQWQGSNKQVRAASAVVDGSTSTWGTPKDLSVPGPALTKPHIALSENGGRSAAIWSRSDVSGGQGYVVQAATAEVNGTTANWGPVGDLTAIADNAGDPRLVLNAEGTRATAVWTARGIWSRSAEITVATASWGDTKRLNAVGADGTDPVIATSADGSRATAVWTEWSAGEFNIQSASATIAGTTQTWGTPTDLTDLGPFAQDAVVGLSGDGTRATALWDQRLPGLAGSKVQSASAVVSDTNGSWGPAVDLATSSLTSLQPDLALSSDGSHAAGVWGLFDSAASKDTLQTATASIDGKVAQWGAPANLSASAGDYGDQHVRISADGSRATAAWYVRDGDTSNTFVQSASSVLGSVPDASQSITFPQPPDTPLDAKRVTLQATASSGLPVSYSTVSPSTCEIDGKDAVLLVVGRCTITANQAGDVQYGPAQPVSRTFAITAPIRAAQTVRKAIGVSPKSIRRKGKTVLLRKPFRTQQGQRISVAVKAKVLRGKAMKPWFRLVKSSKAFTIRTFGYHLRLRVTWKAKGTDEWAPYRLTRIYRT